MLKKVVIKTRELGRGSKEVYRQWCNNCGRRLSDKPKKRCENCGSLRPKIVVRGNKYTEEYPDPWLSDDMCFAYVDGILTIRTGFVMYDSNGTEVSDAKDIREFLRQNEVRFEEIYQPTTGERIFKISKHKVATWANAIYYGCTIRVSQYREVEIAVTKESDLPDRERFTNKGFVREVLRIKRGAYWGTGG